MVRGYRALFKSLHETPSLKDGLVVDTNVLISATYDSDHFFDQTNEFLDLVTSDLEMALTIKKINPDGKICFVPDELDSH